MPAENAYGDIKQTGIIFSECTNLTNTKHSCRLYKFQSPRQNVGTTLEVTWDQGDQVQYQYRMVTFQSASIELAAVPGTKEGSVTNHLLRWPHVSVCGR